MTHHGISPRHTQSLKGPGTKGHDYIYAKMGNRKVKRSIRFEQLSFLQNIFSPVCLTCLTTLFGSQSPFDLQDDSQGPEPVKTEDSLALRSGRGVTQPLSCRSWIDAQCLAVPHTVAVPQVCAFIQTIQIDLQMQAFTNLKLLGP